MSQAEKGNEQLPDSIRLNEEMRQYLQEAERGSPRYMAFMDNYWRIFIAGSKYDKQAFIDDPRFSGGNYEKTKAHTAGEIRVLEFQLAIHQQQIMNRSAEVKGYYNEYWHLYNIMEEDIEAYFDHEHQTPQSVYDVWFGLLLGK